MFRKSMAVLSMAVVGSLALERRGKARHVRECTGEAVVAWMVRREQRGRSVGARQFGRGQERTVG